jgi:hypothetical protein
MTMRWPRAQDGEDLQERFDPVEVFSPLARLGCGCLGHGRKSKARSEVSDEGAAPANSRADRLQDFRRWVLDQRSMRLFPRYPALGRKASPRRGNAESADGRIRPISMFKE